MSDSGQKVDCEELRDSGQTVQCEVLTGSGQSVEDISRCSDKDLTDGIV